MPSAELIAIGTELLLGEIQDTNTRYLARSLRDVGIDLFRATVIGDNVQRISQVIQEACSRADIIITSGGLGPTVDDPTRQAVALAVNSELEFKAELWDQIQARFQKYGRPATENNRRQAFIPRDAIPIENRVGTAPAFIVERPQNVIISLPGVPRELEYLLQSHVFPYLKTKFQLTGIIKACVLHTAGVGESQIDEWISDLETTTNPTVGLLAHPGQIDIRVTAKADSSVEADALIQAMVIQLQSRIGDAFYGFDNDILEGVIKNRIIENEWDMVVSEHGFRNSIINRLKSLQFPLTSIKTSDDTLNIEELITETQILQNQSKSSIGMGVSLVPGVDQQWLYLVLNIPGQRYIETRSYGGPPANGILWATNIALDYLRRHLNQSGEK